MANIIFHLSKSLPHNTEFKLANVQRSTTIYHWYMYIPILFAYKLYTALNLNIMQYSPKGLSDVEASHGFHILITGSQSAISEAL